MGDYRRVASEIFLSHYDQKRPLDWIDIFGKGRPLMVEIGFGQGEHLVRCVDRHHDRHYIGIELDWGRIRKCFKKIRGKSSEKEKDFCDRLRILQVDAWAAFERLFEPKTVDQIECLFPCPWPKDRHEHHRLFCHDFLRLLNSRLKANGSIHVVTDHWPYAGWILEEVKGAGFTVQQKTIPAQYETKFERKWRAEGQQEFCELIFQKNKHVNVAVKEDAELKAYYCEDFHPEKFLFEEYIADDAAIVAKDWIYDEAQQKGMLRVVISEEHLTQHVWIGIVKTPKGWCVLKAQGQHVLPTPGLAKAIELAAEAVKQTSR